MFEEMKKKYADVITVNHIWLAACASFAGALISGILYQNLTALIVLGALCFILLYTTKWI